MMAVHLRRFQKCARIAQLLEFRLIDKVIMHTLLLARTRGAGGERNGELKRRITFEYRIDNAGFASPGGSAYDKKTAGHDRGKTSVR